MAAHGLTDGLDPEVARKREIFRSIKEGFALFDPEKKGMCDVREIGTIVRHLGINPTEIELRDMITEIEEEEPTGFIAFERFERMMQRIMLENQYPRDSEEKLLRAFRTLDPENKGYVEADKIRTLLTTHGERFSQEEIEDFLHFAVDAESGVLHYEGALESHNGHAAAPDAHACGATTRGALLTMSAARARRLRGAGRAVRRRARRPFRSMGMRVCAPQRILLGATPRKNRAAHRPRIHAHSTTLCIDQYHCETDFCITGPQHAMQHAGYRATRPDIRGGRGAAHRQGPPTLLCGPPGRCRRRATRLSGSPQSSMLIVATHARVTQSSSAGSKSAVGRARTTTVLL